MGQKTDAGRRESEEMSGDRDPVLLGGWVLPRLDFPTFRITLIAKVMDRLTLRRLSGLGDLTYAEWRVLSRLATTPNGATVGEIADLAWVDRAEVSRAATSLQKRGLTARRENPADRRKPILFPTDAGWAQYGPLANDRAAFHSELVADLTEEERRQLDHLLAKIARRLVKSLKGEAVDKA
ncbi:MAG: MarR family winged helix-turn-helix transcriptional regulator [Janthinobacterium lividum]